MVRKNQNRTKLCPLLDQECQKLGCMIYNEKFERCEIGLLAYNAYLLSTAIKQHTEKQNLK
jgi:hypothetical protein